MNSEVILIINFVAYWLLFIYFLRKDKCILSIRNVMFLWLGVISLFSYLFYIQPLFKFTVHNSEMTLFPFIYLFISFFILFLPYRYINKQSDFVQFPMNELNKIINCSLPLLLIIFIPLTALLLSGNFQDMHSIREQLYNDEINRGVFVTNWLLATIFRLYKMVYVLLFSLSFYCVIKIKKNFKIWCFIFLPFIISIEWAIYTATRATFFFIIVFIFIQWLLYKDMMTIKQRGIFRNIILVVAIFLTSAIAVMSISRFKDSAQLYAYKYAGESMINFNGLLFNEVKETTNGRAYFAYIPSKLGLFSESQLGLADKWSYIENKTNVSGQFFYTIVGAFILEFGKISTVLILLFISICVKKMFKNRPSALRNINISFISYQFIAGGFLFLAQGDQGNMSIVFFVLFNIWISRKMKLSH